MGDVPLGSESACMRPHAACYSFMSIGAPRIMLVLMQLRFHKLGGVPNMSECSREWWKARYCRLVMLAVFMLYLCCIYVEGLL